MAIKRILVLIIFAVGMVIPCFALVGNEHASQMNNLLANIEKASNVDHKEVMDLYKYFSSSIIDDNTGKKDKTITKKIIDTIIPKSWQNNTSGSLYEELKEYAVTNGKGIGLGNNHRYLFHWGFSGDIPFNSDEFKTYLDQFNEEDKIKIKKKIVDAWKTKVNNATIRVERVFHLEGHPRKAKALAGIIYDVHLIGDSTEQNKILVPLQDFKSLKKDLIKNVDFFLGKNSPQAKEFREKINKVKTADDFFNVVSEAINVDKDTLKKMVNSPGYNVINIMKNKLGKIMSKLSDAGKAGLTSAGTTAALSSVMHGYKWLNNQETACEAMASVVEESVESGASVYVSTAVVQKFGDKYAITVLLDGANHSMDQLAGAAIVNHGLATFCMDSTRSVYHFIKGDIDGLQFTRDVAKAGGRAAVSGACAAVSVCIATTVGGPVILAIIPYGGLNAIATVGGWVGGLIFDGVISKAPVFEKLTKDNYFFIEDVLGNLPLSMQHKITAFDSEELRLSPTIFDDDFMNKPTGFDNDLRLSPTIFDDDYGKHKPTAFDTEDWIIRNGHLESKDGKRLTGNEF